MYGLPEQRVQISPTRFLVPDLCVVPIGLWEKIVTTPPLIAIEILSPEDTLRRAEEKAHEYLRFGVKHVWVIDPYARVAYRGTAAELERVRWRRTDCAGNADPGADCGALRQTGPDAGAERTEVGRSGG